MAPRPVALAFVLAFLMAGCVGDPDNDEGGQTNGQQGTDAVDVPAWEVGHHWRYRSIGAMATGNPFDLVVSGEAGADWLMDTTEADLAFFHARTAVSYLGGIRKSDLAGSQGSDRVKFFDFPLEDGKTWQTRWDGMDVQVTAEETGEGVFEMTSQMGDRVHARYQYDADVGFFREAAWLDENGTTMWGFEFVSHGESFTGVLKRVEFGSMHPFVAEATSGGVEEMEIAAEWNELGFVVVLVCNDDPAGQLMVGVNSPESSGDPVPMLPSVNEPDDGRSLDCREDPFLHDSWEMENPGGLWEFGLLVTAPSGVAHLIVEERARLEIPFP